MIKLFCGNDAVKVRAGATSVLETSAEAGGSVQSVEIDRYEACSLASLASGASLFGETSTFFLDKPSENKLAEEELMSNLELLRDSRHLFVIIEGNLTADEKRKWSKYAEVLEYKAKAAERFNTFALADAFAKRDRKSLWLTWNEARLHNIAPEELVGILWWQMKSLRLAALTSSAEEAGMKDFPFEKAKRALNKFKPDEVEELSHSLLDTYHQSRLGGLDLDFAIERWLLRI